MTVLVQTIVKTKPECFMFYYHPLFTSDNKKIKVPSLSSCMPCHTTRRRAEGKNKYNFPQFLYVPSHSHRRMHHAFMTMMMISLSCAPAENFSFCFFFRIREENFIVLLFALASSLTTESTNEALFFAEPRDDEFCLLFLVLLLRMLNDDEKLP
jgi:hypothetical protein